MNDAIARIYALQQRELNEKIRQQELDNARHRREIAAFQNSGLPTIFGLLVDVPLRQEVQTKTRGNDFKSLCWSHKNPANSPNMKDISLRELRGNNGPQWRCAESLDTGRMKYCYRSGTCGSQEEYFDEPGGHWLTAFIEYAAAACDPDTIAQILSASTPEPTPAPTRRQIQPV
jgi:hypothetical protein